MSAGSLILSGEGWAAELRRWGFAALIVVGAHAGLAAGYLMMPEPEPEGAAAAPAVLVDLAPMPAAPSSPDDLAPGPEMVEAQATPKPPPEEQVEPEVVEPIQKVETPSEVVLPEAKPEPKVVEKKPEEPPQKETQPVEEKPIPQQANPAPRTTGAPRSRAVAQKPAAPSPGSAASRAAIASWRDLVVARLQQNKRYPSGAESRREQGVVRLRFTVSRSGQVTASSIVRSSGHASLDQEVLAMIRRAQPLPAFPAAMQQSSVSLVVPIRFSLR